MTNKSMIEGAEMAPADSNLDNILAELEFSGEADAVEEVVEEISAEELTALDGAIAKSESYEEQSAAAGATGAAVELEAPAVTGKTKKPRKAKGAPKAAKAPKVVLSALPDSAFALSVTTPADKAAVMASRPTQKKIAEKFDNLLLSANAGKAPSKYTKDCFDVLNAKTTVTSGELVTALTLIPSNKGTPYTIGTARSQVGQFMTLATILGIATRAKQTLTINEDSALVKALRAL